MEWLDSYQRMTNSQRRCLEALGVERKALKDITPSLATYIKQIESKKAEGGGVCHQNRNEQGGVGKGKFTPPPTTRDADAEVVE